MTFGVINYNKCHRFIIQPYFFDFPQLYFFFILGMSWDPIFGCVNRNVMRYLIQSLSCFSKLLYVKLFDKGCFSIKHFQASGRKVTISLPLHGREMSLPAAVGLKNRIQPTGSKISNPPDHVYITLGFASGVKHVIWDISYFTSLGE